MPSDIGARIGIDGEKSFRDSLKAIDSQLKNLNSEMGAVVEEFAGMESSQEAVTKKTDVLTRAIESNTGKLNLLNSEYSRAKDDLAKLEKELEETAKQFGENSSQAEKAQNAYNKQAKKVNDLGTKINNTKADMSKMERQMQDLSKTTDDLSGDLENASNKTFNFGDSLKAIAGGNLIAGAVAGAAGAVAGAVSSLINLDEATAEYRENSGKLDSAFTSTGKSAEDADKAYQKLYGILGDSDQATEAGQLLAQLAQNTKDVDKWATIATGVVGTFGDALPVEGLIEASNETAKVGVVTGQLADALNWVGISEDEFNAKLAAAGSEQERNKLITDTLTQAYQGAAEAYRENNAQLIESRELQAQLDESMGKLGESIGNIKNRVGAEFLPAVSDIVGSFADMIDGVEGADEALSDGIEGMLEQIIENLPEMIEGGADLLGAIISGIIGALPDLILAIPEIVKTIVVELAGLAVDLITAGKDMLLEVKDGALEAIGDFVGIGADIVNGVIEGIKNGGTAVIEAGKGLVGWIKDAITNDEEGLGIHSPSKWGEKVGEFVDQGIAEGLLSGGAVAAMKELINSLKGETAEAEGALNIVTDKALEATEDTTRNNAYTAIVEGLTEGEPILLDYLENGLQVRIVELLQGFLPEYTDIGVQMMAGIAHGVRSGQSQLINAISSVIARAIAAAQAQLDINSPSGVFEDMGMYSIKGYIKGWKDNLGEMVRTVTNGINSTIAAPSLAVAGAGGGMNNSRSYAYGDIVLNIAKVENSNGRNVETLAKELEFIRRQQATAKGGRA